MLLGKPLHQNPRTCTEGFPAGKGYRWLHVVSTMLRSERILNTHNNMVRVTCNYL